jgi:hypothetical protein
MMLVAALAGLYVVLLVALVEATGGQGTVLAALLTFLLYGVLPLAILGYLFFSPARRRLRRAAAATPAESSGPTDPDGSGHPTGATVATEREEA